MPKNRGTLVAKFPNNETSRERKRGKVKSPVLTFLRGGLEMLFSDQRQHKLVIPAHDKDSKPVTIAYLIDHLCQHVMKDSRKELFVLDDHMYVPFFHCPPCLSVVQRPCHSQAALPACVS